MTGLMIKDFTLMKRQGRSFLMIIAFTGIASFAGSANFSSFISSYLTIMVTMFSFSSFSYDEYENGMAFLMALPSGRRNYVKAKYLFGILVITGGWLTGSLIRMLTFLLRFSMEEYLEVLPSEPVYLILCLFYIGCSYPALMKYGAEKGRNAAFTMLAVICIGVYVIARSGLTAPVLTMLKHLEDQSAEMILALMAAVCILVLAVSYAVSMRIMERKEF